MTRYALIDTNSGYVWWTGEADTPEAACAVAHYETGNAYTEAPEWSDAGKYAAGNAYDVYEANADYECERGGDDRDEIAAVEAMPFVGRFKHCDEA